jgi:hypothetical protein
MACAVLTSLCAVELGRAQSTAQTNSAPGSSAASPAAHGEARLQQLEQALGLSLKGVSPQHLLDEAEPNHNPLPAAVFRHAQRPQQKKTDWLLTDPLEVSSSPAEDWLNKPTIGGDDAQKKKGELESFYEQLQHQRERLNGNFGGSNLKDQWLPGDANPKKNPDDKLPEQFQGPVQKLKQMLGLNSDTGYGTPAADHIFGTTFNPKPAESSPNDDQAKAHKLYMDAYRNFLQNPVAPAQPLAAGPRTVPQPAYPGLDPFHTGSRPVPSPVMATVIPTPGFLPDHNSTLLNQWNPLYIPPKPEEPKVMPLFSPPVDAPKRRF